MHVHVAIFKWKEGVPRDAIAQVLRHVEALKEKVASISRSMRGEPSKHASGFNHVVFMRASCVSRVALTSMSRMKSDHIGRALSCLVLDRGYESLQWQLFCLPEHVVLEQHAVVGERSLVRRLEMLERDVVERGG
jgi:hypothetical protein